MCRRHIFFQAHEQTTNTTRVKLNRMTVLAPATQAANDKMLKTLPFSDMSDFEDAQRGLIAKPDTLTTRNAKGDVVWDLESYKKYIGLSQVAPAEVNPSLYRMAQLNLQYGLFKVTDRIYQVRAYDLSNITFIQGDTGWIVFDPLISVETAKVALELANKTLGKSPGGGRCLQPLSHRPLRWRAWTDQ